MEHDSGVSEQLISSEREKRFLKGYWKLMRANILNLGVAAANYFAVGANALSGTQFFMESADFGMAAGTHRTHTMDKSGEHRRASKLREKLYGLHAVAAAMGMASAGYYWNEPPEVSAKGILFATGVGVLNLDAIRTIRQQLRGTTSENEAVVVEAEVDEPQVNVEVLHTYNDRAVMNIAITNVFEAGAGILGAGLYRLHEQAPSVAAFVGSGAVLGYMLKQIPMERQFRSQLPLNA